MPATLSPLALAIGLALAVAACGGSATPAPPSSPPAPAQPAPTRVPGGGDPTALPSPGLLPDQAWGAAWDALPPSFPVPAGARPAEPGDPSDGPVSGAFVIDGAQGEAALIETARQLAGRLDGAGYSTESLAGPLEDGSLVIVSAGRDPACQVQTRVRPLGGVTMITVLFGAACPWD